MKAVRLLVLVGLVAARSAAAQVGYPPSRSPYLDVEPTMELTPFGGWLSAKKDPARVAPQAAALSGLQYEWRASGALALGTDLLIVNSQRLVLDPSKAPASRAIGTRSNPLYVVDGFLAVALTGERTWHHLMPTTNVGLGLISDFKGPDVGGFKFGTRFAFPWGAGVRWIPSSHIQVRADVRDWMYSIGYPESYYVSGTSDPPILTATVARSRWTNNFAMTLGVSLLFSH
ncbi:MAG TPA: hypothetical protein VIV65_09510 [Gemmatimonadaceae bacterium]